VTAIASDPGSSATVVASFADGAVKVFDRRLEEEDAIVRSYTDHSSWVQNVRWRPNLGAQLLSAR
jgi:regulator-associated protein of mTOR